MLTLLTLMGCPFVSDEGFDEVQDVDGDGLDAERFGGRDCDDSDPDVRDCDADRDGFESTAVGGPDCDDTSAAIRPDAIETCDGIDNDCDGLLDDADDGVSGLRAYYLDQDRDGYGTGEPLDRCLPPEGRVESAGDCDDSSSTVNPGIAETCDAVDRNCDGDPLAGATRDWFADVDGDGFGDPAVLLATTCDRPEPTAVTNPFDCDDDDANAHPADRTTGLTDEICDGIDNDCDGFVDLDDPDLDASAATFGHPDVDGDGFGDGSIPAALVCNGVTDGTDCNDDDPTINPGATERCDTTGPAGIDGVDEDCDGLRGSADPDNDGAFVWFRDQDADASGVTSDPRAVCDDHIGLAGFSPDGGDCNDQDPTITADVVWFLDSDFDGFGDPTISTPSCFRPVDHVRNAGDCNDDSASIRPGAQETCDGVDEDCDGVADNDAPDALFGYLDGDGDGFGDTSQSAPLFLCPSNGAVVANNLDCVDDDDDIFPGAPEDCGGVDRNCDGRDDEDDPRIVLDVWYRDQDLDGFGEQDGPTLEQCDAPLGYVSRDDDCDDDAPLNYFETYRSASTADANAAGALVDDLAEVLLNPGRCRPREVNGTPIRERTTIQLAPDQPFFVDARSGPLVIDAYTTIALQPAPGQRASVCWDPTTSVVIEGALEMERVDLQFGVAVPSLADEPDADVQRTCQPTLDVLASPFRLAGFPESSGEFDDASQLVLSDVALDPDVEFAAPMIAQRVLELAPDPPMDPIDPFDLNDAGRVTLERMAFTQTVFQQGLLEIDGFRMAASLFQVTLEGVESVAPLVNVAGTISGVDNITLDDLQIVDSSLPAGLFSSVGDATQPLDVTVRRLDVQPDPLSTTNPAPLFCMGSGGCSSTSPVGERLMYLDIRESNIEGRALAHLAAGVQLQTTAVHGGPGTTSAPWVRFVGTASTPTGWTSHRDRLEGDIRVLSADQSHFLRSTHVAGSLTFDDPSGDTELVGVSIVGGILDVTGLGGVEPAGVVLVDGATVTGASTAAPFGTDVQPAFYTVNSPDPSLCGSGGCPVIDPATTPLVVYDTSFDARLLVPFPRAPYPPGLDDQNLTFDGVPWSLDPNTDALPTAWLQLQAAHPSCWPYGSDVFNASTNPAAVGADPDGDGRSNVDEAGFDLPAASQAGSWPCIPD